MYKFSDIDRFRNAYKGVIRFSHERGKSVPSFDYIGTVKLHGTNAGVRRTPSGDLIHNQGIEFLVLIRIIMGLQNLLKRIKTRFMLSSTR